MNGQFNIDKVRGNQPEGKNIWHIPTLCEVDEKDKLPHCVTREPLLGSLESRDVLFVTQMLQKHDKNNT